MKRAGTAQHAEGSHENANFALWKIMRSWCARERAHMHGERLIACDTCTACLTATEAPMPFHPIHVLCVSHCSHYLCTKRHALLSCSCRSYINFISDNVRNRALIKYFIFVFATILFHFSFLVTSSVCVYDYGAGKFGSKKHPATRCPLYVVCPRALNNPNSSRCTILVISNSDMHLDVIISIKYLSRDEFIFDFYHDRALHVEVNASAVEISKDFESQFDFEIYHSFMGVFRAKIKAKMHAIRIRNMKLNFFLYAIWQKKRQFTCNFYSRL